MKRATLHTTFHTNEETIVSATFATFEPDKGTLAICPVGWNPESRRRLYKVDFRIYNFEDVVEYLIGWKMIRILDSQTTPKGVYLKATFLLRSNEGEYLEAKGTVLEGLTVFTYTIPGRVEVNQERWKALQKVQGQLIDSEDELEEG